MPDDTTDLRREEDWKRIARIEFVQEAQVKEMTEFAETAKKLEAGLDKVNSTFNKIYYVAMGVLATAISMLVGIDTVIMKALGL
jgi:hypothetical protein